MIRQTIAATLAGLALTGGVATAGLALDDTVRAPSPIAAQACFPRALWDAPRGLRPCYGVPRPAEDGSGYVEIIQDRRVTWCRIPNPAEEPRHFRIHCDKGDPHAAD